MSRYSVSVAFLLLALSGFSRDPAAVDGARILGFFPSPSPSHLIIHCAIADTLAAAGHNVTVIAPSKNMYKHAKYEYIQTDAPIFGKGFIDRLINNPDPFYRDFTSIPMEVTRLANETFANSIVKQFLATHGPGSFDLIILGYFMNDFHLALSVHFQCPVIISFMLQPFFSVHNFMGNPTEASYVPTLFSGLKQPLNFWGRLENYLYELHESFVLQTIVNRQGQKYYDYNFPPDRYPPFSEVRKNVSLVFSNHHFSQGPIRPNLPNIIEVGGVYIKEQPDPLPIDIAKILDDSKEGFIYFSLGTNIKGTYLTPEKAQIMFNVVSKLPYKVLWKWSDADFPGQSKNIIYKSWLPQDDILAHPNIKLFITHGGMGSVLESQYHGVPMVGIPLFADQPSNMAKVQRSGYGLFVNYVTMTEESLNNAVQEVLNNPKYTNAVREFSKLYRDRPMTARQTVVYWVDYVLRHKGAKHMQSPAVHMNRWQLMSLDVIAFLLAIVLMVVLVFVVLCRLLCCRKSKNPRVSRKRKNE